MSMLTDPAPESLTIAGKEYKINTDYNIWIRYELLLTQNSDKSDDEIFQELLLLIFPEEIPPEQHYVETVEKIMWFYRCGKENNKKSGGGGKDVFSYEYDDGYIAAAFKQQYGVNLNREKLHWWEFHAYMLALSENTEFIRIMSIRAMKIDPKMTSAQKSYYQRMKSLYELPVDHEDDEQTRLLEEALINGESIDDLL